MVTHPLSVLARAWIAINIIAAPIAGAQTLNLSQTLEKLPENLRSVGTPPSCETCSRTCTPVTDSEVRTNAQTPFQKKFSGVTTDYRAVSKSNVANHERTLIRKTREFEKYLAKAEKLVPLIERQITFTHSTNLRSALAIVESGAIKSMDELIRSGVLPLESKLDAMTKYQLDGQIGEQDTVFLGIRNSLDRDALEYYFGNVTFQFDKSALLEQGYFTPYPFGFSTKDWGVEITSRPCREDLRRQAPLLAKARDRYRKFLFSGTDDYRRWLKLSIAQELWKQHKERPGQDIDLERYASLDSETKSRIVSKVLASYKTMPLTAEGWSFLNNTEFDWWELKIPQKVSLKHLESVQVTLSDEDDKTSLAHLEKSLQTLADQQNQTLTKSVTQGSIVFRLTSRAKTP